MRTKELCIYIHLICQNNAFNTNKNGIVRSHRHDTSIQPGENTKCSVAILRLFGIIPRLLGLPGIVPGMLGLPSIRLVLLFQAMVLTGCMVWCTVTGFWVACVRFFCCLGSGSEISRAGTGFPATSGEAPGTHTLRMLKYSEYKPPCQMP